MANALGGAKPSHTSIGFYSLFHNANRGTSSDFTIDTVAGNDWFKLAGSNTRDFFRPCGATSPPGDVWKWATVVYRRSGTLVVGEKNQFFDIGPQYTFRLVPITTTTFDIELGDDVLLGSYTVRGTADNGGAHYTTATEPVILIQKGGGRDKVWINGTLEIDIASTKFMATLLRLLDGGPVNGADILQSGQTSRWRNLAGRVSATESDRPDTSPTYALLGPNANTSESDAGSIVDCADAAEGEYQKWDDWVSGPADGDTTYNCFDEASERKEVSGLSTGALIGNMDLLSVVVRAHMRGAAADKAGENLFRLKDNGGSSVEIAGDNQVTTVYNTRVIFFNTPPAGTWGNYVDSNGIFNGTTGTPSSKKLEAGIRTPSANDVNIRVTSIAVEVCALGNDPPPVVLGQPITRRRGGSTEPVGAQRIGRGW